jgi:hypothetical protein
MKQNDSSFVKANLTSAAGVSLRQLTLATLAGLALASSLPASENAPHAPFAQWANLPEARQFVVGMFYDESESYHIWAPKTQYDVTVHSGGERYGIDINQGWLTGQYGITEQWAVDLSVGYTTVGWRKFSEDSGAESTSGLMDTAFGVRYQVWNESQGGSPWTPTLTFRVGALLPGTYSQHFPFAPGVRSAAVEPEMLVRKHFGWTGLGAYGDALFRWNRTTANDQYILAVGLFQQIKGWEIQAGYRHLGSVSGSDIVYDPNNPSALTEDDNYPVGVRENNDAIEAGFSYTTSKRHWQYGFYSRTVLDGSNSDNKFWFGGYINVPIGGKKAE